MVSKLLGSAQQKKKQTNKKYTQKETGGIYPTSLCSKIKKKNPKPSCNLSGYLILISMLAKYFKGIIYVLEIKDKIRNE